MSVFAEKLCLICTLIAYLQMLAQCTEEEEIQPALTLKDRPIPNNGVVKFSDIGGYLGPKDGLICTTNFTYYLKDLYWTYPNGTAIKDSPNVNVFGVSDCGNGCVSLYYGGNEGPLERGEFTCHAFASTPSSSYYLNSSAYIVNMQVNGPTLITSDSTVVIAGDTVSITVNVTTSPDDTPIPYQWQLNGNNLYSNIDKYQGMQSEELTIFNVEDADKGLYTCIVANSASGISKSLNLTVVTIDVDVSGSTATIGIGKSFTLSCTITGDTQLVDLNPDYDYQWTKDGELLDVSNLKDTYQFDQLEFEDAGNYECQIFITFDKQLGRRTINDTSDVFSLVIPDVIYRIYLKITSKCSDWTESSIKDKVSDINNQILRGIRKVCENIQVPDEIITNDDHAYKCPKHLPNNVMYEAHIQGTSQTNTTTLVSCLDKWLEQVKVIQVNLVELSINKECTSVVNKQNTPDCSHGGVSLSLGDGFAIGFGISTFVLIVIIMIMACTIHHYKRRNGYNCPDR